jgi:hypothetical protein
MGCEKMNCNNESGSGMFTTQGHEWSFTVKLKKYDERINDLSVKNKEILLYILEHEYHPRLYERIKLQPVDYGDELQVLVTGFTKEWMNIPIGFNIKELVYSYLEKVLDVLELKINDFEHPGLKT